MNYIDELKCPLCKMNFNQHDNLPRLLIHCGHTLCTKCIINSLNVNNNQSIICPEDSMKYDNVINVESFPKNIYLLKLIQKTETLTTSPKRTTPTTSIATTSTTKSKLMESIKKATTRSIKKKISLCPIHPSRNLELICIDDKTKICTNCALFGKHKHHNITSIDEFEKDIEIKSELLIDLFDILNQHNITNELNNKNISSLNNKMDNLINIIDRKYNDISYTINSFINELIANIKHNKQNVLDTLFNKFKQLKTYINYYKCFPNEINIKLNEWKCKVECKLNKLNDITDIDEECVKLIECVGDENGYNYLIEQGDVIMNDIEKVKTFPHEQLISDINNIHLYINDKVFNENLFQLKNDINYTELLQRIELLSITKVPLSSSTSLHDVSNKDEFTVTMNVNKVKDDEHLLISNSVNKKLKGKSRSNMCFDLDSIKFNNSTDSNNNNNTLMSYKTLNTCVSAISIHSNNNGVNNNNKKVKNKTPPSLHNKSVDKDKHELIKKHFQKDIVNISRIDLNNGGAQIIAELLNEKKSKIKELKLIKCNINDTGAILIFKAIEHCTSLNVLNIANNNITNKSLDAIMNMLKKNNSLKIIYFTNNDFNTKSKETIKSYVSNTRKIFI